MGERIVGGAVNRIQVRQTVAAWWREQGDAVRGIVHVQIDASHVSQIVTVFVPLKEKVPPVIKSRGWTSGIVFEDEVSVLVRFCFSRLDGLRREVTQITESSNDSGRVLQGSSSASHNLEFVSRRES